MTDFIYPFPPGEGWQVLPDAEFGTFAPGCAPGGAEVFLLVQVTPEGNYCGNFRVILCADQMFRCTLPANRILPVPPAANYMLTIEARPEEMAFRRNGVSSGWFDVNQR